MPTFDGPRSRMPLVVTVLLGVAIAAQMALIVTRMRSLSRQSAARRAGIALLASHDPHASRPVPGGAAEKIVAAHLFGQATVRVAASRRLPERPWVLTGIIATQDPHGGYAMVGATVAKARTYRTGTKIAPGVTLAEVFVDHVVVEIDDERKTLRIPWSRTVPLSSHGLSKRSGTLLAQDGQAGGAGDAGASENKFAPPPLSNSGAVWRALNLRPRYADGQRVGEWVDAVGPGAKAIAALGLQRGDVIVSVNGAPLNGESVQAGGANLWQTLQQGEPVTLTVERNGQSIDLPVYPDRVAAAANLYRTGSGS